jgi:hypothetical protein
VNPTTKATTQQQLVCLHLKQIKFFVCSFDWKNEWHYYFVKMSAEFSAQVSTSEHQTNSIGNTIEPCEHWSRPTVQMKWTAILLKSFNHRNQSNIKKEMKEEEGVIQSKEMYKFAICWISVGIVLWWIEWLPKASCSQNTSSRSNNKKTTKNSNKQ